MLTSAEYIGQLEAEINGKVMENNELAKQNRALLDENTRLTDLTRMLLSSPSFSNFLNNLSSQPEMMPQPQPAPMKHDPEEQQRRQVPKDVNPFGAPQPQTQMNLAMIPEMDYSNFNPQVFTVETPEVPFEIDASMLSGKSSNFVGSLDSDDKVVMPSSSARLSRRPSKRRRSPPTLPLRPTPSLLFITTRP